LSRRLADTEKDLDTLKAKYAKLKSEFKHHCQCQCKGNLCLCEVQEPSAPSVPAAESGK
jgi:hypothetical protein